MNQLLILLTFVFLLFVLTLQSQCDFISLFCLVDHKINRNIGHVEARQSIKLVKYRIPYKFSKLNIVGNNSIVSFPA